MGPVSNLELADHDCLYSTIGVLLVPTTTSYTAARMTKPKPKPTSELWRSVDVFEGVLYELA